MFLKLFRLRGKQVKSLCGAAAVMEELLAYATVKMGRRNQRRFLSQKTCMLFGGNLTVIRCVR